MTPYFDDGQVALWQGHVLDVLRNLKADSVQCVVTSPPYWSLRSYGTEPQVWGGDAGHTHEWTTVIRPGITGGTNNAYADKLKIKGSDNYKAVESFPSGTCPCGAWRGELGHEPTPQMFVAHLVQVFAEVKRVLKPDGVLFVNLGDSYSGSGKGPPGPNAAIPHEQRQGFVSNGAHVLAGDVKAKSLVLIPERFALAMQDAGWYVRSRIAWCKRAPMPESVRDRPTNAWEHVWMFTRSSRYYWDADAVREAQSDGSIERWKSGGQRSQGGKGTASPNGFIRDHANPNGLLEAGRNMWNYWLLSPDPEPLAHFATFPREIPRRCIAAATSERGECPQCGRSWVRVTETTPEYESLKASRRGTPGYESRGMEAGNRFGSETPGISRSVTRTGWAPQCDHGLEPVPQTILDPFVGSGTTTMVARSMFRRSIGIDLSEEYLRTIAVRKNAQMAMMPEREVS